MAERKTTQELHTQLLVHEKECGERWAEAIVELRELRKATDSHAARWEKVAWLVITVVVTGAASVVVANLG